MNPIEWGGGHNGLAWGLDVLEISCDRNSEGVIIYYKNIRGPFEQLIMPNMKNTIK